MDVSRTTTINVTAGELLELVAASTGQPIPEDAEYDFHELSDRHSDKTALALSIQFDV